MQDEWRPNLYYHIIGKAVPGELLFREEQDYRNFLRKRVRDLYGLIFQIYVYCLLPNHYHLIIRTRTADEIEAKLLSLKRMLKGYQRAYLTGESTWREFVISTFGAATNAHAQYYNRKYDRKGQLFVKPTLHGLTDKGKPGEAYSRTAAAYVAFNYWKHGLAPADFEYPWSSFSAPKYHIVEPDIELHYGSVEDYKAFHLNYLQQYGTKMLDFDEERFWSHLTPRSYVEGDWRWNENGLLS